MNRRDKIKRRLSAELASHRVAAGMTQQQLADRLGCHARMVQKVELGKGLPSLEMLSMWVEVLEMDQCTIYRLISVN